MGAMGMLVSVFPTVIEAHVTGPGVQAPATHVSPVVQLFPSLHVVPSATVGFEQAPVPVLQVPAVWHWSCATHVTGFDPVQVPDTHVSVCVQAFPSLQPLPSALAGFEQ